MDCTTSTNAQHGTPWNTGSGVEFVKSRSSSCVSKSRIIESVYSNFPNLESVCINNREKQIDLTAESPRVTFRLKGQYMRRYLLNSKNFQ